MVFIGRGLQGCLYHKQEFARKKQKNKFILLNTQFAIE